MKFLQQNKNVQTGNANSLQHGLNSNIIFILLLLTAAAIRFLAIRNTVVVNPDAAVYIHQARAISSGNWHTVLDCLRFLSPLPLLINLFHLLIKDWILAAQAVSLLFGTLAIIPLRGLLDQFLQRHESLAATAVLAFLPTWVHNSADVVRDPICWFFSLYGLYWLARGVHQQRRLLLSLSCLAFLVAAWARIEALWYPIATCLFLPLVLRQRRVATLLSFSLPLLAGGGMLLTTVLLYSPTVLSTFRLQGLPNYLLAMPDQYQNLRQTLAILPLPGNNDILSRFIPEARNLAWLVGLGTLFNRILETLTYFFFVIAIFGLFAGKQQKNQELTSLFWGLTCGAVFFLYIAVLTIWTLEYRYTMLVLLPLFPTFGAGLSALTERLHQRTGISKAPMLATMVLLLLLPTLPRDIKPKGTEEIAFREIGLFIDAHHARGGSITIATSAYTARLIHLYANQHRSDPPCPDDPAHQYATLPAETATLLGTLRERGIYYLLWEENNRLENWPLTLAEQVNSGELMELGRWHNHQTGQMILYQLKQQREE